MLRDLQSHDFRSGNVLEVIGSDEEAAALGRSNGFAHLIWRSIS